MQAWCLWTIRKLAAMVRKHAPEGCVSRAMAPEFEKRASAGPDRSSNHNTLSLCSQQNQAIQYALLCRRSIVQSI